jgi:hypothetical protein
MYIFFLFPLQASTLARLAACDGFAPACFYVALCDPKTNQNKTTFRKCQKVV